MQVASKGTISFKMIEPATQAVHDLPTRDRAFSIHLTGESARRPYTGAVYDGTCGLPARELESSTSEDQTVNTSGSQRAKP